MDRLYFLKDAPKTEKEAIKLYYRRIGRDAFWEILDLLYEVDIMLTKNEICEKINRKNIGSDLRFLEYIGVINHVHFSTFDTTYCYGIDYEQITMINNKLDKELGLKGNAELRNIRIRDMYNIISCKLDTVEEQEDFIKKFKPKKRTTKKNKT